MSGDGYRNLDGDRLVLSNCEEVYVKAVVLYRVELELVKNCEVLLAVAELKVNDIRCRSVGKTFKIFLCDSEENVLDTCAVDVAWYKTLFAEFFDCRLVAGLTNLAVQCEMFHFFNLFKMCYSVLQPGQDPIAPKASAFSRVRFRLKMRREDSNNFRKRKIMLRIFFQGGTETESNHNVHGQTFE